MEDDEETKSHEVVKEIKTKGTKASKFSKVKPSGEVNANKKVKLDVDKLGMPVKEVEEAITVQGKLKPLSEFDDKFDDADKTTL